MNQSQSAGGPSAEAAKPNYKKTLNLPKTSFPMKANLVQNEPASMKRWEQTKLYARLQDAAADGPRFVFHDGPPYANGSIHLGHLLNKCLKDMVVRSKLMAGANCPYIPGWDCHGLPIEHKVMTDLVESGKIAKLDTLDDDTRRIAIRKACRTYAEKFHTLQTKQMKQLLTLADYDHPYLTMTKDYEASVLEVFADLVEQGLAFRDLKPVHWSVANETALAEAELEYEDREDISVYVEFESLDPAAVAKAFSLEAASLNRTPTFMIWTTTPWTLPANLAVAAHPRAEYALVELAGSLTVLARELVERIAGLESIEDARIVATATGEQLVGLRYRHPFLDTEELAGHFDNAPALHRIVAAEYVTMEDGTGLVHTAPGHGADDYAIGLREGIPIYCPVQGDGSYDETAPEWLRGVIVWDANKTVTDRLAESGHLFHQNLFTHSYPHDWRGKSPVIFRATEQWFVGVDTPARRNNASLREAAFQAADKDIAFIPEWGRNRMRAMLETRPDWCISRQRSWGLPIPAFHGPDGQVLLTAASVRAIADVVREKGSDCWFTDSPADLLKNYDSAADADAPANLDIASLTKSRDIFDVWFESGSSWNAVMRQRSDGADYPIDLYLEGSDQHRGWFQLSLLCGLGSTGVAPYKTLLTHGFIVDKNGRKMSKSIGNTIEVEALLQDFGADVCRWWTASLAFENDMKVDLEFFQTAGDAYRKVRNTLRFLLSNLSDYESSPPGKDATCGEGMCVAFETIAPTSIDAWILTEYNQLAATVLGCYERFDFRGANNALFTFCNDTLSAVYLTAVKDRLYCDPPNGPRRRQTQTALWELADGLSRLLAPIIPHTADEAHRALHGADPKNTDLCVHEQHFIPRFNITADPGFTQVLRTRDLALKALETERNAEDGVENPLDAGLTLPDPDGALARFDAVDLADLLGVSRVAIDPSATAIAIHDLRDEPRCERSWKRDCSVRERSDGGMLSDRDAQAVGVK